MKVIPVRFDDHGMLAAFRDLPFELHQDDPWWVPSREPRDQWDRGGPFLDGLEAGLFLAEDRGRILARAAALLRRQDPDRPGMVGFFESTDEPEPAAGVLSAAESWLSERGKKLLWGPMNGSTWHSYRFVTSGSGRPPFFLEPYNPAYYPRLWESAGWKPAKRYFSALVPRDRWMGGPWASHWRAYIDAGYGFRTADMRRWREEMRLLFRLSRCIFRRNAGFAEISEAEFMRMNQGSSFLLRPQNLLFALEPGGREIGFLLTLPDEIRRVRALGRSPGLAGKLRFLATPRESGTLLFKTIGVLPGMRKVRPGAALLHEAEKLFASEGWRESIHALMSEDNVSRSFSRGRGEDFRQYTLFSKEVP